MDRMTSDHLLAGYRVKQDARKARHSFGDTDSYDDGDPSASPRFSYLRWQVAAVTQATRCSSAEPVAVATGGEGL